MVASKICISTHYLTITFRKVMIGTEFIRKMEMGDSSVWNDLMPMLHKIVRGACHNLGVYDDHLTKDIMQDVATRVFTKWRSYSRESALSTWLYSIARNRCLDEMRKRKVRGDGHNKNLPDDSSPDDSSSASSAHEPYYEDKFDFKLCIQQVLNELDAQGPARRGSHRMIDVLKHWVEHNSTTEELAMYLKTSVQAAKQRKYAIRKHIEELCRKFCGDEDYCLHISGGAS
jgi:RNA polymerase sigma factor (sigma-70 family)